ncbi:MAG: hypothetical protein M0P16_11915 [Syntrophales bacterium]|nr:hypothetical protein [Syntrophales bacterium]
MFVKVAIPIPKDQSFDYIVPTGMEKDIVVGKRVLVPFGNKRETGCIVGIATATDIENPKEIIEILDQEPLFDDRDLAFYSWTADYYLYPLGKVLGEILPGGKDRRTRTEKVAAAICNASSTTEKLTEKQRLVLKILRRRPKYPLPPSAKGWETSVRPSLPSKKKGLPVSRKRAYSALFHPFSPSGNLREDRPRIPLRKRS